MSRVEGFGCRVQGGGLRVRVYGSIWGGGVRVRVYGSIWGEGLRVRVYMSPTVVVARVDSGRESRSG